MWRLMTVLVTLEVPSWSCDPLRESGLLSIAGAKIPQIMAHEIQTPPPVPNRANLPCEFSRSFIRPSNRPGDPHDVISGDWRNRRTPRTFGENRGTVPPREGRTPPLTLVFSAGRLNQSPSDAGRNAKTGGVVRKNKGKSQEPNGSKMSLVEQGFLSSDRTTRSSTAIAPSFGSTFQLRFCQSTPAILRKSLAKPSVRLAKGLRVSKASAARGDRWPLLKA